MDRSLLVILGVIAVLVLIARAVVVVATRGAPEALGPSTPEGIVQAYPPAVIDGDEASAGIFLAADAFSGCGTLGWDQRKHSSRPGVDDGSL
jgi:hypothetical protein